MYQNKINWKNLMTKNFNNLSEMKVIRIHLSNRQDIDIVRAKHKCLHSH